MIYKREEMIEMLKSGIMNISFTKVDGTERIMRCTLQPEKLPVTVQLNEQDSSTNAVNLNQIRVFDLQNNGWRSFRLDSVKEAVYV